MDFDAMYERIKALCLSKKLSISELQRRCGLNSDAIRRWKEHSPSISSVKAVADELGTTVDYLIGG